MRPPHSIVIKYPLIEGDRLFVRMDAGATFASTEPIPYQMSNAQWNVEGSPCQFTLGHVLRRIVNGLVPDNPAIPRRQKLHVVVRTPNNLIPANAKQLIEIFLPRNRSVVVRRTMTVELRTPVLIPASANTIRRINNSEVEETVRHRPHIFEAVDIICFADGLHRKNGGRDRPGLHGFNYSSMIAMFGAISAMAFSSLSIF